MQVNCRPFIQFIQCVQTTRLSLWRGVYPCKRGHWETFPQLCQHIITLQVVHHGCLRRGPHTWPKSGSSAASQEAPAELVCPSQPKKDFMDSLLKVSFGESCLQKLKTHSHPRSGHRLHCRQTSCIQWPARVFSACTCHRTVSVFNCSVHCAGHTQEHFGHL